jgi:F-type H+-transporting ATPase subunit a
MIVSNSLVIFSPFEPFELYPFFSIYGFSFGVQDLAIFIIFSIILLYSYTFSNSHKIGTINPNRYQIAAENIYKSILSLTTDSIKHNDSMKFFPLVFSIFLFHFVANSVGALPYAFSLNSHIIATFFLSLSLFIGINIICVQKNKIKTFSLFLPSGTSLELALLLIPIEILSYLFKPISLSIRLFANMMAGHVLLKVIVGFAVLFLAADYYIFTIFHYLPLLIAIPLIILELAVGVIQSFVFSILICIYINDALNLH